jgi:endoglucanase
MMICHQLKRFFMLSLPIIVFFALLSHAGAASVENIRLNQLGFYPAGPKIAVVVSPETWYFSIKSPDLQTTYYSGELSSQKYWTSSGENLKIADFSGFTREGTYVVYVNGIGASYPFSIRNDIHSALSRGLIRAFYYQRASAPLPAKYAGIWQRDGGHFDDYVIVHNSAASDPRKEGARKAGEVFSAPRGWYDAGDYGKYVVNAGITTYSLLLLYQQFSTYFDTLNLNIPESGGLLPDLLDEIKWEMDWLLKMQDPADGGVYHKLTGPNFLGDLMPASASETRYFIGKGSAATFDFAAVCALAYRIYRDFIPSFADSCLEAAKYAFSWGLEHPDSTFTNPPDIVTGEYGDRNCSDEHFWAAVELFLATGDSAYSHDSKIYQKSYGSPAWPDVGMLGFYSMAVTVDDSLSKSRVLSLANSFRSRIKSSQYQTTVGNGDFYWGSNGVVANYGMATLVAYLLSKDPSYLESSIHSLDYLLGRNATGYSFVTGFGSRSARNPHHRPSTADGIPDPIPGFLVGGPNNQSRSGEYCPANSYPIFPAKAWLDNNCSFTTNEVAINWNAPAAFLAGGLEAIFNTSEFDLKDLYEKRVPDTIAPQSSLFRVSRCGPDEALITLTTTESTVVAIEYSTDPSFSTTGSIIIPCADSTDVTINGLIPSQVYYVRCTFIDVSGNFSAKIDSLSTIPSPLYFSSIYSPEISKYRIGEDLRISFSGSEGITASLLFSEGGKPGVDTLGFKYDGNLYNVQIPGEKVTVSGIIYSILLIKESDTLLTARRSIAPESVSLTVQSFTSPKTYRMVSIPLIYSPVSSYSVFKTALGDTSKWRYYGYESISGEYIRFDEIRSGEGGWLYHTESRSFTHEANGIKPDTLFPVSLKKGWNCVGNPFPFPVFWDNSLVKKGNLLIRITDVSASRFMRRQYFTYEDKYPDTWNNGEYFSNRDLVKHVYNDTARLYPWQACWVYVETDSVTCFINPASERVKALGKKKSKETEFWTCLFKASTGAFSDISVFGASEAASDGYDTYDSPRPPSIHSQFKIGFSHPDWGNDLYMSDIVGLKKGSHSWMLKIKSTTGKPVTLSWEKDGNNSGSLILRDPVSGTIIDMNRSATYTFSLNSGEEERELEVSWNQNCEFPAVKELNSWSFTTAKTGAGTALKIQYTVPSSVKGDCPVFIGIYDISGRSVYELVNERRRAGKYTVTWEGTGRMGSEVSRGMYIARFKTPSYSKTRIVNVIR